MSEERYISAYERNVLSKSRRDQILYMKSAGWNIRGTHLYLCEYYSNGEYVVDYFLGKKVTSGNNGQRLLILSNLDNTLTGGFIKTPEGVIKQIETGVFNYEATQENLSVNLNCDITSFISYDGIAEELKKFNFVEVLNSEEEPHQVLEYVRTKNVCFKSSLI